MIMSAIEKYFPVRDPKKYAEDDVIRPGKSISYNFDLNEAELSARHKLYFTGETRMFYMWKNEPDAKKMYYEIEDALNIENAEKARYCLDLSMKKPVEYTKRVLYESKWPPRLSYLASHPHGDDCVFGISVKAEDLKLSSEIEGSCLRFMLEIWEKRADTPTKLTNRPADKKYIIDIPTGSYDYQDLSIPVVVSKENTAYLAATIEGMGYSGNVYFESPKLCYNYHGSLMNTLPDFNTSGPNNEFFDWMGMNISKKEWPEFKIEINGQCIFDDEIFERCHRYAEMEVAIPDGVLKTKDNTVKFTLTSNYFGTLPYAFREIAVLEHPGGHPFEVIYVPRVADVSKEVPVLIRTNSADLTVNFECDGGELSAPASNTFAEKGLNVIKLNIDHICNGAKFRLVCDGYSAECSVERMVIRGEDNVITGTSDQVYISQEYNEVEEYLAWYVANEVGNFLTSRPIYRWGGARVLNKESWKMETRILNDLGIKYAHMTEGRDLPGIEVNPSIEMLEGEHFLGRQMHEKDGQMYYWSTNIFGTTRMIDMYYNLAQRIYMEKPDYTDDTFKPTNYTVTNNGVTWWHAENIDNDIKKTADESIRRLIIMGNKNPRHTGPSIMSKYFYEAGFDFFGAELMYGSMETNVSFLRGTAKAYDKKRIGAHHALQWSSSPHDVEEKYRRYRLALYVGYMQGITDINTEEGLWHIEEYYSYFNRFSDACRAYLKQQQDFARYVASHTRRGVYYTPMAFIHGRYDGTLGFGHDKTFGVRSMKDCDAEKSWVDMLNLFYPLSRPGDPIYVHDCPAKPVGYHTGTPIGNVDSIPFEGTVNMLPKYKAISFVGYNYATEEDMDRVYDYVTNGGTAILSWPHLSTTTNYLDIENNVFDIIEHKLVSAIVGGTPEFGKDSVNGIELEVCTNITSGNVIAKTDLGAPLKIEIPLGEGKIVLVNAKAYPHNSAILDIYTETVKNINAKLISEEVSWIECGNDVEFTIYDRENGNRDFYVLAVDWYNDPSAMRHFVLTIENNKYDLEIPFGVMLKIAVNGNTAVFSYSEDAEICFVDENTVNVQGIGEISVMIVKNGNVSQKTLDFSTDPDIDIYI